MPFASLPAPATPFVAPKKERKPAIPPPVSPPQNPQTPIGWLTYGFIGFAAAFLAGGVILAIGFGAFMAGRQSLNVKTDQETVEGSFQAEEMAENDGSNSIANGPKDKAVDESNAAAATDQTDAQSAFRESESAKIPVPSEDSRPSKNEEPDLVSLIATAEKSVVRLTVLKGDLASITTGSGFVVDVRGTIATNYHVVEGARSVLLDFESGESSQVDGILYLDPLRDIALLHADRLPSGTKPLSIEDKPPKKGERVTAIGAPLGLSFSATEGIVSATRSGREVSALLQSIRHEGNWVQTTAPISKGNSGGPLLNQNGWVIGLNTLAMHYTPGAGAGENINFAISGADLLEAYRKSQVSKLRSFVDAFPAPASVAGATTTPLSTEAPLIDKNTLCVVSVVEGQPSAFLGNVKMQNLEQSTINSLVTNTLVSLDYNINTTPTRASHVLLARLAYYPLPDDDGYTCGLVLFERQFDVAGKARVVSVWETKFEGKLYGKNNAIRTIHPTIKNLLTRGLGKAKTRLP